MQQRPACDHSSRHSVMTRYSHERLRLFYERVCDDCGAALSRVDGPRYVPSYNPSGRPPEGGA